MQHGSPGSLCDYRRVVVPSTPLAATRSIAPPAAAPPPAAPLVASLSPYVARTHRRIADALTPTRAMTTSSAVLDCGGGGGGGDDGRGGGGTSCSPRSARLPQGVLSSNCAIAGSHSHPSSRHVACQGYVGQGARPAAQYHECDFDWDEHARAVRHLVAAQQAQALELRLGAPGSVSEDGQNGGGLRGREQLPQAQALGPRPLEQQQRAEESAGTGAAGCSGLGSHASPSGGVTVTAAPPPPPQQQQSSLRTHPLAHHAQPQQPPPTTSQPNSLSRSRSRSSDPGGSIGETHGSVGMSPAARAGDDDASSPPAAAAGVLYEGGRWEEFYRAHPSARFFKERRYLLLEFPELLSCGHVAEIGCGCGSSILPVLKANAASRTTCTDISTTCLHQLREAAAAEGIDPSRIRVFPADATDPAAAPAFEGIDADALLIMFTLSAVTPERQHVMLTHAWRALAPGGRLMLRDHGLYDMVQLRIPADQWVGPNLYKRGDGTMAFFFSTEDLENRAMRAGFDTVECKYVTVINRNRKTGAELRRVFVHGVFEKPAAASV